MSILDPIVSVLSWMDLLSTPVVLSLSPFYTHTHTHPPAPVRSCSDVHTPSCVHSGYYTQNIRKLFPGMGRLGLFRNFPPQDGR